MTTTGASDSQTSMSRAEWLATKRDGRAWATIGPATYVWHRVAHEIEVDEADPTERRRFTRELARSGPLVDVVVRLDERHDGRDTFYDLRRLVERAERSRSPEVITKREEARRWLTDAGYDGCS